MIAALLLLPLASATPRDLVRRQATDNYAQVSKNITQTITDIIALNTTVNSYGYNATDLGSGLIGTYNGAQTLATDIQNTVNAAQSSSAFTTTESQNLYLNLASLLEPTFELLDNFVAHCNAFANVGIKSIVVSNLQSERSLVQQEGSAIAAKVAAPYPQSVAFGAGLILSKFDSALNIFTQSSCPPPGSTAFATATGGGSTVTVTAPGSTVTAPGGTVTKTVTTGGATVTAPGSTVTAPGSTVTAPGGTVTKTITTGGATVTAPGSTVTLPGAGTVTVTAPGGTVTVTAPGGTVTVTTPGGTVTAPGGTVTVTAPGGTVTAPGSTVTKTITTGGAGGVSTITAPPTTITSVVTKSAGSCTTKSTATICFFWQPCWGKTKRSAEPTPAPFV